MASPWRWRVTLRNYGFEVSSPFYTTPWADSFIKLDGQNVLISQEIVTPENNKIKVLLEITNARMPSMNVTQPSKHVATSSSNLRSVTLNSPTNFEFCGIQHPPLSWHDPLISWRSPKLSIIVRDVHTVAWYYTSLDVQVGWMMINPLNLNLL